MTRMTRTFEIYYIVQIPRSPYLTYPDKIVAGPYYDSTEAYKASDTLEQKNNHRETVFKVMSHTLELE